MSSPSLQNLSQSRTSTSIYGSNGAISMSASNNLPNSRLTYFSTSVQQSNTTNSNFGISNSRSITQPSSLTNGFLGHQSNQITNSKLSSNIGLNLSSNFSGSNSIQSNFGNNNLVNSGLFGSNSTSPNMVPSSAGSFVNSVNTNTQGSSHIFGSGFSNNSQFGSLNSNSSYSSFNSNNFTTSLDLHGSSDSLDLSEFPSLQPPSKQLGSMRIDTNGPSINLTNSTNSTFSLSNNSSGFNKAITGNKTYSEVSNSNLTGQSKQDTSPGFQISHEDFPALPGAPKQLPVSSQPNSLSNDIIPHVQPQGTSPHSQSLPPSLHDPLKSSLVGVMPNKTSKSIVLPTFPSSMCKDQFGMAGLLAFIRSKDTCPNLIKFALGMDLCDLGLNLQGKGKLHSTFQSPWSDRPCGLHHLEQNVPQEYLTSKLSNRLNINMLHRIKKYGDDLLFWLYYNNVGTTIQLLAIRELQNRGWMYYIPEKIWITKALGKEPPKGPYDRAVYCWFDVVNWKKSEREMTLERDRVEFMEPSKTQNFGL